MRVQSGVATRQNIPTALTIAGSDSTGGAGVQADLQTFAALRVHGASVITAITAQSPERVVAVEAVRSEMIAHQLEAVFAGCTVRAAKTGMLLAERTVELVAEFWQQANRPPLIVDPVIASTSGTTLLRAGALRVLQRRLLPLATLVTPNVPEAERLSKLRIHSRATMRHAARALHEKYGCAVLLKGGHATRARNCVDVFWDGRDEVLLEAPRLAGGPWRGTGCRLSAAIAAGLAQGLNLNAAIAQAKAHVLDYIRGH